MGLGGARGGGDQVGGGQCLTQRRWRWGVATPVALGCGDDTGGGRLSLLRQPGTAVIVPVASMLVAAAALVHEHVAIYMTPPTLCAKRQRTRSEEFGWWCVIL
eukprot:359829-Chlamydomonas_euryale.AAC.3